MDLMMLRQFAKPAEVEQLKQWILSLRANNILQPNRAGPGRYYIPLGAVLNHPPAVQRISNDLQLKFKIAVRCLDLSVAMNVQRTQATPAFVGMQTEGGFVHPHTDGNLGEEKQFRCTLLVNKSTAGGRLVLGNAQYDMEAGDIYCFVSNDMVHGTTPVQGGEPRIACSLGFLVDKDFTLEQGIE